jgi:hypothetical protein
MKVTSTIINSDEISSEIDLVSDIIASDHAKERIKEEAGAFILEKTLEFVGSAKSPVSGEGWKRTLSPLYAKQKREDGATVIANLENSGEMLQSLDIVTTDDGIKIGVFGGEAEKADGHNNFSGDSMLPQRRFLPEEGQNYKREIEQGVKEIINDVLASETIATKSDFSDVSTSGELFTVLSDILGISGKESIRRAVLANRDLLELLEDLDLLDLI